MILAAWRDGDPPLDLLRAAPRIAGLALRALKLVKQHGPDPPAGREVKRRRDADAVEIMNAKEAAAYPRIATQTLYRLIKAHRLPAFRLGGDWRFWRADIDAWIAQQRRAKWASDER